MKNSCLLFLLTLFMPCMGAFSQCLTPTDVAVSNVTSNSATVSWNGNADSYTVWYGTPPSTSHYLGYGEMTLQGALGNDTESTWTWGVMFPGETVPGNVLTKVGFFNTVNNINDITIRVYSGGDDAPGTLLLTKVVTAIPNTYQLVVLDAPLHLPSGENLWITLEETGIWLMSMTNAADPNSRWYFDGNAWTQQSVYPDKGWIIHGHVENQDYENMEWNQASTTNQSIELTGLNPEHTYVVRVQGHCGQGNDSGWSDELIFITKNAGCPSPTGLTVSNITHNTAELDWSGESESFNVRYRSKAHDVGFFEEFTNISSTPSGWSEKSGSMSGVQNGTVTLTDDHSWSYGTSNNVFDGHAYIDIWGSDFYKWLISPSVAIHEGSFLNFDVAWTGLFTGPAITNENNRFIVAIYDESEATWNIHQEWNNLSNTGQNVNVNLNGYIGKNVRFGFYVQDIDNPYDLALHIDNVRLSSPVPLGAWQTAVESAPVTHATLTDLIPETPYEVEVRGVCSGSISMVADTLSFSTTFIGPSNLVVDDITIDAATLSWTENSEATSWQIQLNDEAPVAVSTNPFTLTGLTPDTEYTVKVRSQRGGEYSGWSDAVDFSTLFYCYPPTQLELVECTLNSATLGWHDHGTADEWQVCIGGDENNLITVNTNQYVMTGLDAQTQYTVKVRARCGETYTDWTDEVSFVPVLYCNPPTLTVDDVNMTTADLSWTAISGADSYTVSYHSVSVNAIDPIITGYTATDGTSGYNSGENYPNLVDNDRTTKWCRQKDNVYIEFHSESSFVPTGYILTTGNDNATAHGRNPKDWVIKGKLNAGDSWTTIATVTNNYVMQDVNFTDYEFELNNTNAYRYFRFEVSAVQSGNSFQLGELRFRGQLAPINTTSTSVSLTGLKPKTDYVAEVRGNIGDLSTNWSNEANFTTLPVCSAPTDLSVSNVTCNSMILSWNQDGTVDDWQICLNDDETNLITAVTTSYTLTGLSAQTAYSVKVRSRKGLDDYSYWSEPLGVSTTAYYQEPTSFAATEIHSYNVVLNWNENSGADEWRLCLNGDMNNLITVNTKPFTLTGLTPETTYTAKISAYHDGSFSGWSNQISFTTPVITPSLTVSNVNQNSANLNWTNMSGASYTVRYNRVPSVLETVIWNGFESGMGWTFGYFGTTMPATSVVYNSHNGSCGLKFVATSGCDYQMLVSPSFEDCESMEFYYKTQNTSETFQVLFYVGNTYQSSTNEITVNTNGQWLKYTCDIPQNTSKVWIKYCGQSQSALWIDDIRIFGEYVLVECNTNSTQLTNLFPVQTYSAKVRTKHGGIYSEWSDAVEFITYVPPTNLTVSDIAATEATISWDENGDATHWQLCLNNDQNNLIEVSTNPFTLTGLTQETHYTFKLRDCHAFYNSAWSDAAEFTTLAYCTAPTDLAVDDILRYSATLSWNADSDTYKVMYRTTGDWILAAENISENTFTLTGLDAETHYEARVIGVCNGIESNPSSSISFTTLLDSTPTMSVSDITYTSAGLLWTETPGADSYMLLFNNSEEILVTDRYTATEGTQGNNGENYPNLVDNNRNSKWFVNRNDGNGHFAGCYIEFHSQHVFIPTGYVLTTAYDTDNNGNHPGRNPKSWVIKAKLNAEDEWTTIESVTNNNVMQNVPLTDYTFTLNNSTPYRYFRFEVLDVQNSSNHRFQLGEMNFLGYSKNSICITDLEPATTYTAKVRAKKGELYSEWSDEFSFSTLFGLVAPTLTVSNVTSTSADLNWSENLEAIGYNISLNDEIVTFPSHIITGYTATSGASGYSNEGYANLVDNDRTTKWCRQMNNVYIEFNSESSFVPTGYILTTGTDNATAHGRNPKDWVIKAKLNAGDSWTTIASVTNDNTMQDINTKDYEFDIDNHLPYRYFRFEVSANHGNNNFQLGEFRFLGYNLTNSLHLTDLQPETDYSVKVRSDLGGIYSDWSNTVDFRTLIQSPTNLTVTDIDYTSATLGWAANSSITQWQICLNGDEDHLILTDTNPYTLTGLNPHTHYTVKVRNCQEGADDAWSDEVGFTTPLYITPPTLTVSDISQTSVVLNWTEISGVDGYTVSVNDAIIPDPIITGYTATSGAGGYNTNEGYANLVDNDRNTKWCRSSSGVYIEFHSQQDFVPTGYVLTTANDTHKNPQRNPKNWVIKAKLNAGDPWTLIATVTNDQVLQNVSTTDFEFAIDNSATYRYFRFEVSAVQSGDSFQLGELRFRGLLTSHSLMLADLQAETDYAVKVRAYSGETISEWSNVVNFTTWPNNITFIANGYWNDAANWNINQVPGVDDEVFIAAQAVVPAGYTAQVKNANVNDGGSITIEDGGQFMTENTVKVAMQKTITKTSNWGTGGSYIPDNWYFIASPVNTEDSDYSVTGLITEGEGNDYDFYRLNGTIWENYKADDFDIERCRGYLYASENGTEIEFNGNAMPYSETSIPLSDGFNLVGNPYTFNTFVNRPYYRLNSDRTDIELVDDNTAIAPCEAVVVDVDGTDQVTFTKTSQQAQANNNGNLSITVTQQTSKRGVAAISDKAIVSFNEGCKLGKFYFKQQDANIYIPQDGRDYAIVYSDRNGEIPLHLKATKVGYFTIIFDGMSLKGVRLFDKIENVTIDLGVENKYTFIGAPNDRKDRFVLLFDGTSENGNDIFAYQNGSDIIVSGEGELRVFDVMGRVVATRRINGVETMSASPFQTGVYIFMLKDKTQKLVVR